MDNRIANADQLLTQDVDKFCDALVELYANVTKVSYYRISIVKKFYSAPRGSRSLHLETWICSWIQISLWTCRISHRFGIGTHLLESPCKYPSSFDNVLLSSIFSSDGSIDSEGTTIGRRIPICQFEIDCQCRGSRFLQGSFENMERCWRKCLRVKIRRRLLPFRHLILSFNISEPRSSSGTISFLRLCSS